MKIRLPADLKDQIEVASKQSGRSMNAEIVARLEQSLSNATGSSVSAEAFVKELEFVRHAYNRQIDAMKFGQELLAHYLIAAADGLPEELANSPHFTHALAFAQGVVEKDPDKLVKGYKGFFPELQDAPVVKELEEMNAKHARGEDVRPYMRQHLDDTRLEWEAGQQMNADDGGRKD